jgi:hypothetical protein
MHSRPVHHETVRGWLHAYAMKIASKTKGQKNCYDETSALLYLKDFNVSSDVYRISEYRRC